MQLTQRFIQRSKLLILLIMFELYYWIHNQIAMHQTTLMQLLYCIIVGPYSFVQKVKIVHPKEKKLMC